MYHWFVRRQVRAAFAALSRGDAPALTSHMHPKVHHTFPGHGALGGERHTLRDVEAWFDRLFTILPGLQFQIHTLAADGPPWDTRVGVEWTNSGQLFDTTSYSNTGAHILRIQNGRITAFHAYLDDTDELTQALRRLAEHGIEQAAAPSIQTADTPT